MYYIYTQETTDYDGDKSIQIICSISDFHLESGYLKNDIINEMNRFKVSNLICKNSKIKYIPDIKSLKYIECINCAELEGMYCIKGIEELYCSNCPKLEHIPSFESIYYLTLQDCGVEDITNLKTLEELYIKDIINFDDCSNLKKIDCSGCKNISIPNLPKLKTLVCFDTVFDSIGKLPKLKQVSGERIGYIKNYNKNKNIVLFLLNSLKSGKNCASIINDINLWKKIFEFV